MNTILARTFRKIKVVQGEAERLEQILEPVAAELAAVEEHISRWAAMDMPTVSEAIGHVVRSGGKRLRPACLLLAAGIGRRSDSASKVNRREGTEYRIAVVVRNDLGIGPAGQSLTGGFHLTGEIAFDLRALGLHELAKALDLLGVVSLGNTCGTRGCTLLDVI